MGIAIFNRVILDLHFPMIAYGKILGQKPTIESLQVHAGGLFGRLLLGCLVDCCLVIWLIAAWLILIGGLVGWLVPVVPFG